MLPRIGLVDLIRMEERCFLIAVGDEFVVIGGAGADIEGQHGG